MKDLIITDEKIVSLLAEQDIHINKVQVESIENSIVRINAGEFTVLYRLEIYEDMPITLTFAGKEQNDLSELIPFITGKEFKPSL